MADTINLKVITPSNLVIDEEVDEVVAPGDLGEFGVLPGHVPFITTLMPGGLTYKINGVENSIIIDGGIAEVREDKVNVLTGNVLTSEEIDSEASRREAESILEELKDFGGSNKELKEIERRLKLAEVKANIKRA
ncbi:MAG: ATP synthase F1 subunit epsilon [Deltaproteobacteria bacterium]|nr:ATP synthase F1 subunit epsilon [Deltaproteobacteria bacterium]